LRKANPPNPSGDDPNVEQNPLEAIMNNSSGNIKVSNNCIIIIGISR